MGTRRRGDELETAIYQVTYQLLATNNGTALTFSQVAKAAHTSRTVLYRYWESPFDLVLATLTHYRQQDPQSMQLEHIDQGSLRADLIYVGTSFAQAATAGVSQYFRQLFSLAVDEQDQRQLAKILSLSTTANLTLMQQVVKNARRRHELLRTPPQVTLLAMFNQIRYVTMIGGEIPEETEITRLVDDLILPAMQQLGR